MSSIALELAIIVGLLVINGLFAMSETAVVAARRIRLEHRADRGDRGASAALGLAREPTSFLSTVQVGITLVGVIAGAFGGATLSERLAEVIAPVPGVGSRAEPIALALVIALITYLSLIIGELVPKRIALSNPERVASLAARPMIAIAAVAHPLLVRLLTASTRGVLRLVGMKDVPQPGLTEEEIHALVEQGVESGVVPEAEHEVVEAVFRLGDRTVASIMTPRPDIEWLDVTTTPDEMRRTVAEQRRPWYLVCDGDVEHVRGIVYANDLLALLARGEEPRLEPVMSEPLYVPQILPAFHLLEAFRSSRQHTAIALDEYGGIAGLVTLDDFVEELVGEVPGRHDTEHSEEITGANGDWSAAGTTPIEDVADALGVESPELVEHRGYRTLGGFIIARLTRLPVNGDAVEYLGYRFTVTAMDGRRIARVRITRLDGGPRVVENE